MSCNLSSRKEVIIGFVNKTLLRLLTNRKEFNKLNSSIVIDRFDKEERAIISGIRKHWQTYNNSEAFSMEIFAQKFFLDFPMDKSDTALYKHIFNSMLKEPDPEIAKNMIRDLRTMEYHKEIENIQTDYTIGKELDLYDSITGLSDAFQSDIKRNSDDEYCTANVKDVLEDSESGSQLEWKLDCLRKSMPGVRTGMQIIVAMRPGMGKTSFCADNGMYWMQSELAIKSGRPIVWLNNEGKKIRIKGSFIRSALGMDFPEISNKGWEWANEEFSKQCGGEDRLRIYDVHGKDSRYIERIIDRDKPFVVFWDMLDNIKYSGSLSSNDREDQKLEALYKWSRECAVKYDFLSIPTSQVSVEGAGLQYIPASCLKGSKTGKQGACDSIITIGSKDKEGFENSRYIYIAKDFKGTALPGANPRCRTQVVFDPAICRYINPVIK